MTGAYELRTFSAAGVEQHRITDFDWLSCAMRVRSPGILQAQLPGNHRAITDLENGSHVELWRKDAALGIDWYRYFGGFYRSQNRTQPDKTSTFLMTCPGYVWKLSTRIVNWAANTASRSAFTSAKAETVMKTLVDYNAGSNATTGNGRKRDGAITGISVQADGANGNTVDWYCHGDVLLETLQKLAKIAGGDFDLVKTGTNTFEFRWYTGQLGTDRTATVKFALELGNLGAPRYTYSRIEEKTVACVWGKGEGANRAYATRTGADYGASNDIEFYVNASDVEDSGLNSRGDEKLDAERAREEFGFKVIQTPACQYGQHYFLGDLTTVVNPFTGASAAYKVNAAILSLTKDQGEDFEIELGTP